MHVCVCVFMYMYSKLHTLQCEAIACRGWQNAEDVRRGVCVCVSVRTVSFNAYNMGIYSVESCVGRTAVVLSDWLTFESLWKGVVII